MKNILAKIKRTARAHLIPSLCICGLAGGFINGLLGAGSGIIFIYALSFLFSGDGETEKNDVFALSLGAVFFVTLFSVFFYAAAGKVSFADASSYVLPALAGGFTGALLLGRVSNFLLSAIFSVIIIFSGISMIG